MKTLSMRWKLARLNAHIARLEREEAALKQQLYHLTINELPALREKRNRLMFPAVKMY